ncbi:MAG: hypothetical protein K1X64_16380 [Myxococcaceae bacterium]|nr:hypothetical protein [Myxococcaceae bacterium]
MRFLTVEEIINIHDDQVREEYGGGVTGLRSLDLLQSVVAQPEATFGGELLHPTIWEQTAAYAYHLAHWMRLQWLGLKSSRASLQASAPMRGAGSKCGA